MGRIAGNKSSQYIWLLLVLPLSVIFIPESHALNEELVGIQQAIQLKGASWTAGETTASRMAPEERINLLGLVKPDVIDEEWSGPDDFVQSFMATALPAKLDWRSYNGGNYVSPVRNQGDCGSCWAFATTAAMESKVLMADDTPGYDLNLAEQLMVSCSSAGDCGGGWISAASIFLRDTGLPLEECFPYAAKDMSCSYACSNWASYTYHISGYRWIAQRNATVNGLKNALYTYGPLVTTMDVYTDFYYYQSGVYSLTYGSYKGGHAILLVGYDDAAQCFIAKNSWGKAWGESGFFRIAYSQVSNSIYFGEYTIAYDGQLPPTSPDNPPPTPEDPVVPGCSFSLSTTSAALKHSGGSVRVMILADDSTCSWEARSNVPWIMISSRSSGTGSKTLRFRAYRNTTGVERTGTLTIAGHTVTVTQGAKPLRGAR
jgi:C1A family cysteine protease